MNARSWGAMLAFAMMVLLPEHGYAFKDPPDIAPLARVKPRQTEIAAENQTRVKKWIDTGRGREAESALRCIEGLSTTTLESVDLARLSTELRAVVEALDRFYQGLGESATGTARVELARDLEGKISNLQNMATELDAALKLLDELDRDLGRIYDLPAGKELILSELEADPELRKARNNKVLSDRKRDVEQRFAGDAYEEFRKSLTEHRVAVRLEWERADMALAAKVNLETQDLERRAREIRESTRSADLRRVQSEAGCSAANVLCLDADGKALGGGLPSLLSLGKKITVVVIVESDNHDSITLVFDEVERTSTLLERDDARQDEETQFEQCGLVSEDEVGYKVGKREVFTVPKSLSVVEVTIDFRRTPTGGGSVEAQHSAHVEHGYYYVSLGLFVPLVPGGNQRIVAREVGDERYLALDRDLHVTAGLAMNVFPGGRRRGELTPWSNLRCSAGLRGRELQQCLQRKRRRPWAELLGIQIGADLDVRDPVDQFYFGLVLEPVTGVTFSAGAAVMKIDHLKVGLSEGQLVTSDRDLEARTIYQVRPFASFGLSVDLVQAIRAARDRLEKNKP